MSTPIIAIIVALAIGFGVYSYGARDASPAAPRAAESQHEDSDSRAPDGMSMDEHKRLMDDGETFMAMSNEISPSVLYAQPGATITFASHEPFPVRLETADGAHRTPLANPGDPHTTFQAPMVPGRYEFMSSHDANVKAVLIVEE